MELILEDLDRGADSETEVAGGCNEKRRKESDDDTGVTSKEKEEEMRKTTRSAHTLLCPTTGYAKRNTWVCLRR